MSKYPLFYSVRISVFIKRSLSLDAKRVLSKDFGEALAPSEFDDDYGVTDDMRLQLSDTMPCGNDHCAA